MAGGNEIPFLRHVLPNGLRVLVAPMPHTRSAPPELEKEKRVVLEELGLAQDAPGDWVHPILSELLWPDQPLGREIAGTAETIHAQTRDTLLSYVQRGYGPQNTVLMVAGNA